MQSCAASQCLTQITHGGETPSLCEPAHRRYCELRERLPKVSDKALAGRLRDLVLIRKLDHEQR
jgi:hypothetical protein